ncbi:hypothetical protein [Sandaracinus amylolyticus]|uniref:Uncharacterized protein n=1 Tax=Sandaracinus amylolyticus TaxID=927083 RepID=A0A0F6W4C0_9BACT|nr:hypothetical protein [Sandaracinus amylolyticus]AKF07156.1 hypothetical protein DB32_004305 [Sandaracinus amylolyticus]
MSRARLEELLARAMRADDPVAALHDAAGDPELDEPTRAALARVDPDGVRMQALLVARLRCERLVQGSDEAAHRAELDPRAFAALFRVYHREVPMHASHPSAEGRAFEAWLSRRSR